jgi:hypothetical protein
MMSEENVLGSNRWGGPGEERRSRSTSWMMSEENVLGSSRWGGPGEERRSLPPGAE